MAPKKGKGIHCCAQRKINVINWDASEFTGIIWLYRVTAVFLFNKVFLYGRGIYGLGIFFVFYAFAATIDHHGYSTAKDGQA